MKEEIRYVEFKGSEHTDRDEAWIARVWLSSSGRTVYFNDMALKRHRAFDANHINIENGDLYWISGVKKKGSNKHFGGTIFIEKSLLPWYEEHTNGKCPADIVAMDDLQKPYIERFHIIENK